MREENIDAYRGLVGLAESTMQKEGIVLRDVVKHIFADGHHAGARVLNEAMINHSVSIEVTVHERVGRLTSPL